MKRRGDYRLFCDRCGTAVASWRAPRAAHHLLMALGLLFVARARTGRVLHYCSEACLRAHRGPLAGAGRLEYLTD